MGFLQGRAYYEFCVEGCIAMAWMSLAGFRRWEGKELSPTGKPGKWMDGWMDGVFCSATEIPALFARVES